MVTGFLNSLFFNFISSDNLLLKKNFFNSDKFVLPPRKLKIIQMVVVLGINKFAKTVVDDVNGSQEILAHHEVIQGWLQVKNPPKNLN